MNRDTRLSPLMFVVPVVLTGLALAACDDTSIKESTVDARAPAPRTSPTTEPSDSGLSDGGPKDCFDDPKTHAEIINACTTAVRIAKNPVLPKLLPDGGLPPVP
ncbi:MAG: hypothetical protein IPK71_16885 [Myxococcales bacterium]|nr:hypothetical protein [Myxococcales bacterium]